MVGTGSIWLRIGTGGGPCERGDEPPGSIKCWEVQILKHSYQYEDTVRYVRRKYVLEDE
jgi:hypothetical protein